MLSVFAFLTMLPSSVEASSRPTTFPVDPQLSVGPAANFRELFVDPAALSTTLSPNTPPAVEAEADTEPATAEPDQKPDAEASAEPDEASASDNPLGTLTIPNPRMASAVVTIGDIKVGVLGPLTDGVLSGIEAGAYTFSLVYPTGYIYTTSAETSVPEPDSSTGEAPSEEEGE